MSLKENATTIAENVPKVYEAGKQAEWNEFWDVFQDNGKRNDYSHAFKNGRFNSKTFRPKYDLVCKEVSSMFQYSSTMDLKGILEDLGLRLDVSGAPSLLQMFQGSGCTRIPILDARNATSMAYTFGSGSKVREIEKLMISEKMKTFSHAFEKATLLEKLIIEGVIAINGFDVHWSTLLSHESLISILNALKDYSQDTSGTVWKVTLGTENYAKLSDAELAIAEEKGWVVE